MKKLAERALLFDKSIDIVSLKSKATKINKIGGLESLKIYFE